MKIKKLKAKGFKLTYIVIYKNKSKKNKIVRYSLKSFLCIGVIWLVKELVLQKYLSLEKHWTYN